MSSATRFVTAAVIAAFYACGSRGEGDAGETTAAGGTGGTTTGSGGACAVNRGTPAGNGGTAGTAVDDAGTAGTSCTGGAGGSGGLAGGGVGNRASNASSFASTGGTGCGPEVCGCVPGRVSWGLDGGLGASRDTSALEPCDTFVHVREPAVNGAPMSSCRQWLGACYGTPYAGGIASMIRLPDVQEAISLAPVVYGEDTRPLDGQVLRIDIQGAIIDVGEPCQTPCCKPIPDGLGTLAATLRLLTQRQLARAPCSDTFPP